MTVLDQLIDCNGEEGRDATTIMVVHMDQCLNILIRDSVRRILSKLHTKRFFISPKNNHLLVVVGDFVLYDEKVVENREAESQIVMLDDAFGAYHRDHHCDLHLSPCHDVLVYKLDYHLTNQYHHDW